jgi:hypothetical protein
MSSSSSTCSAQRAAANRANAQHSTGPRTPQGKRAVSQNAATHNAYCADLLQPGEPEPFFHAHREAVLERLCPMDAVELCLADRVVSAAWRLRRLQAADHYLALMEEADLREQAEDQRRQLDELRQRAAQLNVTVDGDSDPLNGDDSCPGLPTQPLSPGLLIAHALRPRLGDPPFQNTRPNSPFERLLAAEQRLQGMIHRALKELRDLQSQRRDHPHDDDEICPFLTPDDEDHDDNNDEDAPKRPNPADPSLQNKATCQNDSPDTGTPSAPSVPDSKQSLCASTTPQDTATSNALFGCDLPDLGHDKVGCFRRGVGGSGHACPPEGVVE